MESLIANLLKDFESGKITRRHLISSIALAATALSTAKTTSAAPPGNASPFKAVSVNHISYSVKDYQKTRDFYQELFGMERVRVDEDRGVQSRLHFGKEDSVLICRNFPKDAPADSKPTVDHIAYTIENWNTDKVKAELERRSLKPKFDSAALPAWASFNCDDINGYHLQIGGFVKPGDSMYGKKPGTSGD